MCTFIIDFAYTFATNMSFAKSVTQPTGRGGLTTSEGGRRVRGQGASDPKTMSSPRKLRIE